ncbi:MAG: hypothetical protein V7752_21815 [Halopseudomonas sp.]
MEDRRTRTAINSFEVDTPGKVFGHKVKAALTEGPAGRPLAEIKIHHPDQKSHAGRFSMTALQALIHELQCLKKCMKEHNKTHYKN